MTMMLRLPRLLEQWEEPAGTSDNRTMNVTERST